LPTRHRPHARRDRHERCAWRGAVVWHLLDRRAHPVRRV